MNLKEGFRRIFFSIGVVWFIFFFGFAIYNFFSPIGISLGNIFHNIFFAEYIWAPGFGTYLSTYRIAYISEKDMREVTVYYYILISFLPFFIFEVKNLFSFLKRITILVILWILPLVLVYFKMSLYYKILTVSTVVAITYALFKFLDYLEEGFLKKDN